MKTFMERQEQVNREDWIKEILRDKEKFIKEIKKSPAVIRKNQEAVEQLSKLKPPFPWEDSTLQNTK